jgi:phosphonate transport system permease protein
VTSTTTAPPTPAPSAPGGRDRSGRRPLLAGVLPVVYVATALFGFWWIDVSLSSVLAGWQDTWRLLQRMMPPTFGPVGELASLVAQTLLIAVAGTGLATLASIPLAAAAASTYTGSRAVQGLARALIVVTRAIPSLVFAIIFVRVFGLGPMAGGLAIACHSVGMIAKLYADALEEQDQAPVEAITATGAGRLQTFVATVWSRSIPALSGIVLYRLDINIRASAVLGLVGAGGIGVALQTAMGSLNYPRAAGIVLVIIGLILLLELLSVTVRRRLSTHHRANTASQLLSPGAQPFTVGWDSARVRRLLLGLGAAALFGYSLWALDADLARVRESLPNLATLLSGMVPPAFGAEIVLAVMESLLMAMTATTVGVVLGLGLALLSTDLLVRSTVLSSAVRLVVVLMRGVPDIIYALLFVAALGLGPFAGFLALAISCTALAAKFFTDSLENLDPAPREALEATGATRAQVLVSAVWPQFVPAFLGNSLFTSDLALRESAVLGIVGAGGVGFLLHESTATLHYETTSAILILLIVVVFAIETAARWVRRKVF